MVLPKVLWGIVMTEQVQIKNLSKSFGTVKAVDDLSFSVKKGEFFAFLGVNGAGKSTTISIMCGTLIKDSGEVIIDGKNLDDNLNFVKREIGVVFQNSVLDKSLSVYDNLLHRASLYGIVGEEFKKRFDYLQELLAFKDYAFRTVGKLSGGQKRKIDIARALIHQPNILILDEPTTGLDPMTRQLIWSVIEGLRKEKNITVLLTTHYMEEATDADHVVIIDNGKIIAEGTPFDLKNKYSGDFITIYGVEEEKIQGLKLQYQKVVDGYRITVENTEKATELIIKNPEIFKDYEIVKGKMDDVFLSVTGKSLSGGNK